jgi:hypothetical protein
MCKSSGTARLQVMPGQSETTKSNIKQVKKIPDNGIFILRKEAKEEEKRSSKGF